MKAKKPRPRTLKELWDIAGNQVEKLVDMNYNSAEISTIIHAMEELNRHIDAHIFREKLEEKEALK